MNAKARGESNKRENASAPSTRAEVEVRPVMFKDSTWPHPRKVGEIGDKGENGKHSEIESKQESPTTTTQDIGKTHNNCEGAVIGSHVGREKKGG